jgi:hypothetical protein
MKSKKFFVILTSVFLSCASPDTNIGPEPESDKKAEEAPTPEPRPEKKLPIIVNPEPVVEIEEPQTEESSREAAPIVVESPPKPRKKKKRRKKKPSSKRKRKEIMDKIGEIEQDIQRIDEQVEKIK